MDVRSIAVLLAGTAQIALTPQANAQQVNGSAQSAVQADNGIQEIVVTAQRRAESLQKAAVAVTAVTGDALANAGVTDTVNLGKLVPALIAQPSAGSTSFYLRGVGTNAGNSFRDNAVAFNFAGVFVSRPTAPVGTFYDLERVEVVKGPQGTLYGRNATGGAINVLPKRPRFDEIGGEVSLEYGNYNNKRGSLALNVPLADKAAIRVAAQIVDRDGYLSDGYDDEKGEALRASLLVEPVEGWSFYLAGDYFHQRGKGAGIVLLPSAKFATPALSDRIGGSDPLSVAAVKAYAATLGAPPFCGGFGNLVNSGCVSTPGTDGYLDNNFYGISATLEGDLGGSTLTIIPAYRRTEVDFLTYVPAFVGSIQDNSDQKSLEVRLSSNGEGPLKYVFGGFLFNEDQTATDYFAQGNLSTTRFNPELSTRSRAIFGQLSYSLSSTFRLIAGARYTNEKKTQLTQIAAGGLPGVINPPYSAPFTGDLKFERVTWKAGVEWDAGPNSLIYANVATGFKTGGFFVAAPPDNTYAPEKLTAYTVGTKNRLFDNRLRLNLEAFYWDYVDQQISLVSGIKASNGIYSQGGVTVNAGRARMYGVEAEFEIVPTSRDHLSGTLQYLNGKYLSLLTSNFSSTGAPLPPGCPVVASRLANPGINNARFYDTDCSGKPTVNSPRWNFALNYEHRFPVSPTLEMTAGARTSIESSRYSNVTFQEDQKQGGFMTSDLWLTLASRSEGWTLTGYVNNLENKVIIAQAVNRPILDISYASLRPPRTYGVRVGYKF